MSECRLAGFVRPSVRPSVRLSVRVCPCVIGVTLHRGRSNRCDNFWLIRSKLFWVPVWLELHSSAWTAAQYVVIGWTFFLVYLLNWVAFVRWRRSSGIKPCGWRYAVWDSITRWWRATNGRRTTTSFWLDNAESCSQHVINCSVVSLRRVTVLYGAAAAADDNDVP